MGRKLERGELIMAQLKMYWKNDGTESPCLRFPTGITINTLPEIPNGLGIWQDVIRYMSKNYDVDTGGDYYECAMLRKPNYNENMCYIFSVDGEAAATITVICDDVTKQGCVHMVACKPEFRGRGLGHLMLKKAVAVLKQKGMETAYLTTDDWRIAAIKTYLKAGFVPDLDSEVDFQERWNRIFSAINT